MSVFAVIDTNVIVAALRTKHEDSATARVLDAIADGIVTPLYAPEIIEEYREVLCRPKFGFDPEQVEKVIGLFTGAGERVSPMCSEVSIPDEDDRIFYEVTLSKDGARLVTGNLKHFPKADFVMTPAEFLQVLSHSALSTRH